MKEKIRTPIIWFIVFISLMLFQTTYLRLGTITAFVTLMGVIVTAFLSEKESLIRRFIIPKESIVLILFLIISVFHTFVIDSIPSYFFRLTAQSVLFVVLIAIGSANEREQNCIIWGYIFSSCFYSLFIIHSGIAASSVRYYMHARISVFGTSLDPNFVGLPLVTSTVLLLSFILQNRHRFISIFLYVLLLVGILYTASRGNFLSLVISNGLLLIMFVFEEDYSQRKKFIIISIVLILMIGLTSFFSSNISDRWLRMISFGENADNGRFDLWKQSLQAWKKHPIFGVGLEGMFNIMGYASHNTYIQVLCETGIIGATLFGTFIWFMVVKSFRYSKAMGCMFVGCLVHITFLDSLDSRCLWVILCVIALLPNRKIRRNSVTIST